MKKFIFVTLAIALLCSFISPTEDTSEAVILISKTGSPITSFEIPDKLVDKGGKLISPLTVTVTHPQSKKEVYRTVSKELAIALPLTCSGWYDFSIHARGVHLTKRVQL